MAELSKREVPRLTCIKHDQYQRNQTATKTCDIHLHVYHNKDDAVEMGQRWYATHTVLWATVQLQD